MRPFLLRYGAHFSSFALLYCITFLPFGQRVSNAVIQRGLGFFLPRSGKGESTPPSHSSSHCPLCCLLNSSRPQACSREAEQNSHQMASDLEFSG